MSCRRICRELLWLSRFGELGPSSQPHLDHLVGCRGCRDEVGFDREMVRQLRVALAERIEGMQPSSSSFETILRRAQAPEPSRFATWWRRSIGLVGRLRTATAMAGTGLALVLALQMEVVPIARPMPDAAVESPDLSMLEEPQSYAAAVAARASRSPVTIGRPHPEALITLPPPRGATERETQATEPDGPPGELVVLDIRFERSTTAVTAPATEEAVSEPVEEPVTPVPTHPGQPS